MDVSAISGGAAASQAQKSPADVVAGGVEEESANQTGKVDSKEGSQEAVQAAAQESGVGNSVNIQV